MDADYLFLADFPLLRESQFRVTSEPDTSYNCIAWAVDGITDAWWWPDEDGEWPDSVPRHETLDAFIAAFATRGYTPCVDESLEPEFEKVAIYASEEGPRHAARQLSDGTWTSKLGPLHDIQHQTLESLSGQCYGSVVSYLKRPSLTTLQSATGQADSNSLSH
jgi:hypothetical protein